MSEWECSRDVSLYKSECRNSTKTGMIEMEYDQGQGLECEKGTVKRWGDYSVEEAEMID